jgi:hypothetical protein
VDCNVWEGRFGEEVSAHALFNNYCLSSGTILAAHALCNNCVRHPGPFWLPISSAATCPTYAGNVKNIQLQGDKGPKKSSGSPQESVGQYLPHAQAAGLAVVLIYLLHPSANNRLVFFTRPSSSETSTARASSKLLTAVALLRCVAPLTRPGESTGVGVERDGETTR